MCFDFPLHNFCDLLAASETFFEIALMVMKLLHTSLNTSYFQLFCKPDTLMSSFTHSLHFFLPLHLLFSPTTSTIPQADTQSSPLSRSKCLHRPCFSSVCQRTVDIGLENRSLHVISGAVRMGDSSLNSTQSHHTLALAVSSTPTPAPSVKCVAQIAEHRWHMGLEHEAWRWLGVSL